MAETPSDAAATNWLLALIRAELPAGQTCGDMRAEVNGSGVLVYPYHVVYPLPGGLVTGPPLGQSAGDAVMSYQVDSVGRTREQAQAAAARVRNWICGRTAAGAFVVSGPAPEGLRISDRIVSGTPGALLEGQPPNEVYTVSDSIELHVTVS